MKSFVTWYLPKGLRYRDHSRRHKPLPNTPRRCWKVLYRCSSKSSAVVSAKARTQRNWNRYTINTCSLQNIVKIYNVLVNFIQQRMFCLIQLSTNSPNLSQRWKEIRAVHLFALRILSCTRTRNHDPACPHTDRLYPSWGIQENSTLHHCILD